MKGNHPKRRRDKYNPYWICENNGRYYISFIDGQSTAHEFEISKELYDAFDFFELEDLKYLNEWERHYERREVWEATLNKRAIHMQESLEEIMLGKMHMEKLYKVMRTLSKTQLRRVLLYYFEDLTYPEIAKREHCSTRAVEYSIHAALLKIQKNFKKFEK